MPGEEVFMYLPYAKHALPFAGMTRIRFQGSEPKSSLSAGFRRLPQLLSRGTILSREGFVNFLFLVVFLFREDYLKKGAKTGIIYQVTVKEAEIR